MVKGKLLVLEGIDGSGKSSQSPILVKRLLDMGIAAYETKEPTGSPIGALIRRSLSGEESFDNRVLAGLFASDRLGHLLDGPENLLEKIDRGVNVICDRYYFSSYAYHSADAGLDWVIAINSLAASLLKPSLTIFLDIKPEEAIRRIRRGREDFELFETLDRLKQARAQYFKAFDYLGETEKIAVLDAAKSPGELAEDIWSHAQALFSDT